MSIVTRFLNVSIKVFLNLTGPAAIVTDQASTASAASSERNRERVHKSFPVACRLPPVACRLPSAACSLPPPVACRPLSVACPRFRAAAANVDEPAEQIEPERGANRNREDCQQPASGVPAHLPYQHARFREQRGARKRARAEVGHGTRVASTIGREIIDQHPAARFVLRTVHAACCADCLLLRSAPMVVEFAKTSRPADEQTQRTAIDQRQLEIG